MRSIFFKKSYTKCDEEASPRLKLVSGSTVWNVTVFAFIVYPSQCLQKYIKTKVVTTCFYLT